MSFRIVRNDITKMNTEAIVNTANEHPTVGTGCDSAVYKAAGYDVLLKFREDKIGYVPEGSAFITPGFNLQSKYIIHAVSPFYIDGNNEEEEKLRSCYRNSLQLAKEYGIKSISFPLISTGGFGYPKEEGMRIAVDEINAFLLGNEMDIYLVVFDERSTQLGEKLYPELEAYINHNYVKEAQEKEYKDVYYSTKRPSDSSLNDERLNSFVACEGSGRHETPRLGSIMARRAPEPKITHASKSRPTLEDEDVCYECAAPADLFAAEDINEELKDDLIEELERKLDERLAHRADTFSEYLLYLIKSKNMTNVEVYKRACLTKQYFHKINKNKDFHPEKIKALLLCVGAKLNLDETKDLLARAGYALSPADLTDIIFSFYIEHEHYDVIDIDIQLEEHGLPCVIS